MQTRKQNFFTSKPVASWVLPAACLLYLAGCAQIPTFDKPVQAKPVEQLGSSVSFAAPAAAWPDDHWWKTYGDPQLDTLIEEALRDSPNLAVAQARLREAGAMTQMAGAARMPEVSANASFNEAKQSYNYLMPRQVVPNGWNDYGQATLNLSWELDFWGKNRSALAAATSEQQAAQAEVAQTRLILSTSVASAYADLVHLFTVRDTAEAALALRTKSVELFRQRHEFGLENLASVRQVEARQAAAEAQLLAIDEYIGLQRNGIAALLGAGPDRGLAITRPTVQLCRQHGLTAQPGFGTSWPTARHRRRAPAHGGGRQAHRSAEGRFLSERQFNGIRRRSIVGHQQSVQVRFRHRQRRPRDFSAHIQYRTPARPIARCPCRV